MHGRLEDRQTHRCDRSFDTLRANAVVVVDDKSMRLIAEYHHPELLGRLFRRRMAGHVPMQNSRVPTSKTTEMYSTRNVAGTETKKSQAITARA
jgi:hypothetical protein